MANNYREIQPEELYQLAEEYCEECINNLKTVTASYKIVKIPERQLPTIKYFVLHWLKSKDINFYSRQHYYKAMADENHPLRDTLKDIREYFDALAEDIVANEGKGIFYAKNRLGMTDRQQIESKDTSHKTEWGE